MQVATTNDTPKTFRPFCKECGWRMGGVDSWDGKACKCGKDAPPIKFIETNTARR